MSIISNSTATPAVALSMRLLVSALLAAVLTTAAAPRPAVPNAAAGAVVVELFTSQGCSSCPPADALLSELASDPSLRGSVVPLAFHVDYWNHIGWTDPFSSARWSERQRQYAAALHSETVYTPEIVIGGRVEAVGSDRRRVRALIDAARRQPVQAAVTIAGGAIRAAGLKVDADVQMRQPLPATASPMLLVVVYESGARTRVTRGENSGRELAGDRIVRELSERPIAPLSAHATRQSATLHVDPKWDRRRLGVAVLLQDARSKVIYGAASSENIASLP